MDGGLDGLCDVAHVLGVDSCHADSASPQHVNVVLLYQEVAGLLTEPGVGEHADLLSDVVPSASRSNPLQLSSQQPAHGNDAFGHHIPHFPLPLAEVLRVVEDARCDFCAIPARVRVAETNNYSELYSEYLSCERTWAATASLLVVMCRAPTRSP